MAYTKIYECSACERKVSLSGRSGNERMLKEPGEAFAEKYCLDCQKVTSSLDGPDCSHCSGANLSDENSLPCGCAEKGELVHDRDNVVMF